MYLGLHPHLTVCKQNIWIDIPTCICASIDFNSHTHTVWIHAVGYKAQLPADNGGPHITANSSIGISVSDKYLEGKKKDTLISSSTQSL